ncbi:MAG: AAA family ATPase, partial [Planctomycetia bacterium]
MIHRKLALQTLKRTIRENPVAALLGPRQSGKSTLAGQVVSRERQTHWFDLENTADRTALENPALALGPLRGTVVIDEIQRRPELF